MRNPLILGALLLCTSLTAQAQGQPDYSGTWEWSFGALYQDSKRMDSANGSSLKVDGSLGLGINVGYYVTDRFSLAATFDFVWPDYKAVLVDDTVVPADVTEIRHEFSQLNGRFKANYEFLDGPLRPFVEAGLGWSYFDSNVSDEPPIIGCWWHPYWGYICDGYFRTISDTIFTYGLGAGLKYRLDNFSFLKLTASQWQLDDVGAAGSEDLTAVRLEYGWRF